MSNTVPNDDPLDITNQPPAGAPPVQNQGNQANVQVPQANLVQDGGFDGDVYADQSQSQPLEPQAGMNSESIVQENQQLSQSTQQLQGQPIALNNDQNLQSTQSFSPEIQNDQSFGQPEIQEPKSFGGEFTDIQQDQNFQVPQANQVPPIQNEQPPQPVAAPIAGSAIPQITAEQLSQNNPFDKKETPGNASLSQVHSGGAGSNSSGNGRSFLSTILLFVFFTIVGAGGYLAFDNLSSSDSDSSSSTDTADTVVSTPVNESPAINVTINSPQANTIVEDQITVDGTRSSVDTFIVGLYDANDVLIDRATLNPATDSWSVVLRFETVPLTEVGYIAITSADGVSEYDRVDVRFAPDTSDESIQTDRILFNDFSNGKSITDPNVTITGQMQGFFENSGNYRVYDSSGNIIIDTFFQSLDGDSPAEFSNFSINTTIPAENFVGGETLIWEFYEISAKDGTIEVLTTITTVVTVL